MKIIKIYNLNPNGVSRGLLSVAKTTVLELPARITPRGTETFGRLADARGQEPNQATGLVPRFLVEAAVDSQAFAEAIHGLVMLFYSFFKSLVGKDVVVELKNDLSICGTLHSVDQVTHLHLLTPVTSNCTS